MTKQVIEFFKWYTGPIPKEVFESADRIILKGEFGKLAVRQVYAENPGWYREEDGQGDGPWITLPIAKKMQNCGMCVHFDNMMGFSAPNTGECTAPVPQWVGKAIKKWDNKVCVLDGAGCYLFKEDEKGNENAGNV